MSNAPTNDNAPDLVEGVIVWPIPEEGIDFDDAVTTLGDIEEAELGLTLYAEDFDGLSGNLAICLAGMQGLEGAPTYYFYKPLTKALEEELEIWSAECVAPNILGEIAFNDEEARERYGDDERKLLLGERSRRLIIHLLRTIHEWETNEATWTLDELRTKPLPAVKS